MMVFDRGRSGTIVTSAGKVILRHVRRTLHELDCLLSAARSSGSAQQGEIRLGTQLSIIPLRLQKWLRNWRLIHPGVELNLVEADNFEILSSLLSHHVDAAVLFTQTVNSRVTALTLFHEKLALATNEKHPLARRRGVRWEELAPFRLLVRSWEGSQAYREIQAALVGPGAEFRAHNVSYLALLGLVAMGEGVSIVLESHAALSIPGVVFVPIDEPNAEISVSLVWSPDVEDPVVGNFVAFMRDQARFEILDRSVPVAPSQTPDPLR